MSCPTFVQDVHAGREALARDLERYLRGRSLAELSWVQLDDLTLLVPLFGGTDLFLLKLVFDHYGEGPPSAQFVNPLTLSYAYPDDVAWVPTCQVPELGFHPDYNQRQQLICSSMTLEFYQVNHDVKPESVWTPSRDNFLSTLRAIQLGLAPEHYRGRATK